MLVKLNWLNELVDLESLHLTTAELVEKLSLYSTEIESVNKVLHGTNLTIGHVLTCVDHPDSDHLHITTVDVGTEVLQIVCGAPNIKEGLYVIVAQNGSELPNGIKIKKAKVRGVESNGMICSLSELGMEKKFIDPLYESGIYYFSKEVKPGSDPLKELDFDDDVLELGLTPNRGDLMSMLGVAYEISAVFNVPLKPLTYKLQESNELCEDLINVSIETPNCLSYYAKVIKNVKIKKSPDWLISRLIAFGIRPINNVVDITNYILALYGQPLHAFDYDLLGNNIVIRQSLNNEGIITLDGITRTLKDSDILITDGSKGVALAGVMGGLNSSINDNTKNIVIEAAVFDPISVRKTYQRLDLRSESSIRFEKGVDINRTKEALDYTCYLFETLCDATISKGVVSQGITNIPDKEITITSDYISKYLGITVSNIEVIDILNRLYFKSNINNNEIKVLVPSRRPDISIKADIIEEVGRIHGYHNLPTTLPQTSLAGKLTNYQQRRRTLKHSLVNLGLTEVINYSLLENNNEFTYLHQENEEDIALMLPISSERKVLRRSLIPSILQNVGYSFNRKIQDVAYFEIGKVYKKLNGEIHEVEHLAIAMANNFSNTLWKGEVEKCDFYLLKGIINEAFRNLSIDFDYLKIDKVVDELHPLRTAKILLNNNTIGYIGEIHPKYQQNHDLKNVYVCEIELSNILSIDVLTKIYSPVSKVPSVSRDLALVVKKDVSAHDIIKVIKDTDKKLIDDVIIFDLYVGDKVLEDEKSIAVKVILTSNETLTDEIVNAKINKILKNLKYYLNATLRN